MRLIGGDCRCRETVELARAALEGRELPPRNCPTHAPNAEEEARAARRKADALVDLDGIAGRIHAERPEAEPPPSTAALLAGAFRGQPVGTQVPTAVDSTPPALNSDALLDTLKARLGIHDDLPPAA